MFNTKYDVVFYYPQHFNRSVKGTNPFFDPLIALCEENKLRFLLIEEPDRKTYFTRNKNAFQFDFYFYLILFLRKMLPMLFFHHFEEREQWIGSFFKKMTFNKFSSTTVFTISNSMGGFWRGYSPTARIVDYQHGIISKIQTGFFDECKAPSHITLNNKEVAIWGKGFQSIFNQDEHYYTKKVHVLGYYQSVETIKTHYQKTNKILFSLQFMPEFGVNLNREMLVELCVVLEKFNILTHDERPQIILRNHPRFNNAVDLGELINKYDFVSLMDTNENIVAKDYLLHVTFYSTTAFELALQGIPTFFMCTTNIINGKIDFLEDFEYPIEQNYSLFELWITYKTDEEVWKQHSELVRNWSHLFFEPLNKRMFLNLVQPLNNKLNE